MNNIYKIVKNDKLLYFVMDSDIVIVKAASVWEGETDWQEQREMNVAIENL